jgi:hypothetical protein
MSNLAIILILLGLSLALTIYIFFRTLVSSAKANRLILQKKFKRLQPLYDKFDAGEHLTSSDIYDYAKDKMTRELTFHLLQKRQLTGLFPGDFYTIEKAAESNLANWLEFPTELDACPDEMEHLKKVTIDFDGDHRFVFYHVYGFKMYPPHWAASIGWMLGVVGPYFDSSKPYDHPNSTFSRLHKSYATHFPEEEAKWVHENIFLKFMNGTTSSRD